VRLFKHKKQEQKENRHSSYYIKNHPDEVFVRKWISKYDSILIDKIAQLEKTTKKSASLDARYVRYAVSPVRDKLRKIEESRR
jgi:hypothetical protein